METRTRVKICGITNREDAEMAIALGADALGFNAWPGSKRFIDLKKEAGWIRDLPPLVTKVAVMVNPPVSEVEAVAAMPFIDLVQFHGCEDAVFCAYFAKAGIPFIKAIALRDASSLEDIGRFSTRNILLDAYSAGAFGGTGRLLDLELASAFFADHPELRVTLSGGLNPENVKNAIQRVKPYAVDVASGVEQEPRRKERGLVAAFFQGACGD
ncbi:MAG: phosphoribosylanthranilate isomerase [Verrucomicrobiota bacterium]